MFLTENDGYIYNGDIVVREILNEFSRLPAKGKPSVRSNGIKEWTVVASVFAIISDSIAKPKNDTITAENVKILSIATGVKTIPEQLIEMNENKGYLVHDSHAEILALRLFNYYLLNEVLRQEGLNSTAKQLPIPKISIMEKYAGCKDKYRIKKNIKLGLYISELPCGDSSMNDKDLEDILKDNNVWNSKRIKTNNVENGIVRGRAGYNQLGCLRTKPGRADSLISLSKSCSDKLTVKQYTGILNSISSIFIDPIYLDILILPKLKIEAYSSSICRSFRDRFIFSEKELLEEPLNPYFLKYFQIWGTDQKFEFDKEQAVNKEGCVESVLYLPIYNTGMDNDFNNKKTRFFFEVINNGVKLGCRSKKERTFVKKSSSSMVSSRRLAEMIHPFYRFAVSDETGFDYKRLKTDMTSTRFKAKKIARNKLGEWVTTSSDYFIIS